jgi:prepilin-type processing-associated H-X9-DG protein
LLTVIAIIGILAGVLLPALNQARERGRRAGCASNLKQIGIAMFTYASDNNMHFPTVACNAGGGTCNGGSAPYPNTWDCALTNGNYLSAGVFRCPSDRKPRDAGQNPRSYSLSAPNGVAYYWPQGARMTCQYFQDSTKLVLVGERWYHSTLTASKGTYVGGPGPFIDASNVFSPHGKATATADFKGNYLFVDGHIEWVERVDSATMFALPTGTPANPPCP